VSLDIHGNVVSFDGEHEFLSNFYPCEVFYAGRLWATSEHAYQAAKFASDVDKDIIAQCRTPGRAKLAAEKMKPRIRPEWDDLLKLEVMEDILHIKFHYPAMRKKLHATGKVELIEGNTWRDTFWGVCNGTGHNWLGNILMVIRSKR